jgi:protoporphyrinogen oxidase
MKKTKVAVLGAGLSGLSFAYHFDRNVPVYEKGPEAGGLVRTIAANGYRFDLAPHLLHLRSDYVKELLFETLGLRVKEHARRARIYFNGQVIPYPFELNLHGVDAQAREDCLRGLSEIDIASREDTDALKSGSYRNYVMRAFGPGIARHYLLPYNRKIWDTDPAQMTCEWMKWLPTADIEKIMESALRPHTDSFGYNASFFYPEHEGIRELPDAFASQLSNIHLGKEVVGVDLPRRMLTFSDGEELAYEQLVSTLPLTVLAECTADPGLVADARGLSHTSVCVVNMVVRGTVPDQAHWMYFPDPDLVFYRMSFPKNFFDRATPGDEHILAVEVGSRGRDMDIAAIREKVEEQVLALSGFDIKEHLFTHCDYMPVAYSIYEFDRTARVGRLLAALEENAIYSIGRYGQWEYSAMEDAILHGKNLAEAFRSAS